MQILQKDEVLKVEVTNRGHSGENGVIYRAVDSLKVGQGVQIERDEWKTRTAPSSTIPAVFNRRGKKFSIRTLVDKSGWLIVRKV